MTTSPEQPQPENAPPSSADTPPPHSADTPSQATPRRHKFDFVRHRATQLIAVTVLGLAIGAGISALASHDEGGGDNREHSHQVDNGDHKDHEGDQQGER